MQAATIDAALILGSLGSKNHLAQKPPDDDLLQMHLSLLTSACSSAANVVDTDLHVQ